MHPKTIALHHCADAERLLCILGWYTEMRDADEGEVMIVTKGKQDE